MMDTTFLVCACSLLENAAFSVICLCNFIAEDISQPPQSAGAALLDF